MDTRLIILSGKYLIINTFILLTISSSAQTYCNSACPKEWFKTDSTFTNNFDSVLKKRDKLIFKIWGQNKIPDTYNPSNIVIDSSMNSNWLNESLLGFDLKFYPCKNLKRIDVLEVSLNTQLVLDCTPNSGHPQSWFLGKTIMYHFIPKAPKQKGVILHQGHAKKVDDSMGDAGYIQTIRALLDRGFDVMVVFMPTSSPMDILSYTVGGNNCHSCLATAKVVGTPGSSWQVFFEPTTTAISYLSNKGFETFHMIGLSGGGWTTTFYSALDKRITSSIAIAPGLLPFYLMTASPGDYELGSNDLFENVSVQELYILAASGRNRKHFQVFIRFDNGGSNGEPFYGRTEFLNQYTLRTSYSTAMNHLRCRVKEFLKGHKGDFDLLIDESTLRHQISGETLYNLIIPTVDND